MARSLQINDEIVVNSLKGVTTQMNTSGTNGRRAVILDTDPGIDDAVAIALALHSDQLEVKLMTTVMGNVGIEPVTHNLLKLLAFFNKEVPVAKGASRPLLRANTDASDIHGSSGMAGYNFPAEATHLLLQEHAVTAIYQQLKATEGLTTLIAIGPLTNIALLIRLYPEVLEQIDEIILMGGTVSRGNKGVLSEFNIALDPEAAKIVFESGLPIVMVGLDVGRQALVYPADSERIKIMNQTGRMMYQLFKKYRGGSFETGLKMYDSCAIAYLLQPDLFTTVETFVGIEINGIYTSGATVVDLNHYLKQKPNAKVCLEINKTAFKDWFLAAIAACK